jgi:hypothetical protein
VLGHSPTAPAQQGDEIETFVCASRNEQRVQCEYRSRAEVTVHVQRQLSDARCALNETWGRLERGVWVDRGCSAEFVLRQPATAQSYRVPGAAGDDGHGDRPNDFEIPCESLRGEWVHCDAPQVHLARFERVAGYEECSANGVWGVDDTGIWVRNQCQGEFRVHYRR